MNAMNLSRCAAVIFFVVVSLSSSLRAAEPTLEFSGVMTAAGKTKIALTDTATKTTTWVEPGQQINGYTVERYDAKEGAVFLKKTGRETRLALVASKTATEAARAASAAPAAATTPPVPSTPAAGAAVLAAQVDPTTIAIRSNLQRLAAAARQYQLEHNVPTVGFSQLVGPDKPIKELKPVAGENYSSLNFGPNVTAVSVTTDTGAAVSLDVPFSPATEAPKNVAITRAVTLPAPATTTAPVAPGSATSATSAPPPLNPATTTPALEPTGRPTAAPTYTLQNGDTLEKISAATGLSIQQLKQLNPAALEGSPLQPGQTIRTR